MMHQQIQRLKKPLLLTHRWKLLDMAECGGRGKAFISLESLP